MLYRYCFVLATSLLALGGCTVYTPMQGAAPDIRQAGQLEMGGSYSLTNRFDASVAYSPLPHLLGRVALSSKGRSQAPTDSSEYAHVNQYELGLGTYWPLGERALVGGLAAYGAVQAEGLYRPDGASWRLFRSAEPPFAFSGSYRKLSGEVYGSYRLLPALSLGATYRLVQTSLTAMRNQGQLLPASPFWRSEYMVLARISPDTRPANLLQLQVAMGASRTNNYAPYQNDSYDPVRQFRLGQAYFMVGVLLYPSAWWQHQ